MVKLSVNDISVKGKRVLLRVDFNVPIEKGKIKSNRRLIATIPTISYLITNGAKIIIISHLGRPNGQKDDTLSLRPCAKALSILLKKNIFFLDNCIGDAVKYIVNNLKNGEIALLENLRFYKEEEKNKKSFASKLSELADFYVNDAFGAIHRAHASIEGITHFVEKCAMGLLVSREISNMNMVLSRPRDRFVLLLGGAKISDKISLIESLIEKVECLIIAGGMAYTFLKAKGLEIGNSIFEPDKISFAYKLLKRFGNKILLPIDCIVTDFLDFNSKQIGITKCVDIDSIQENWIGIDIGLKSISFFSNVLYSARTIVWNGPVGIFEIIGADRGTIELAKVIGDVTREGAITIVGGGESVSAIERAGIINDIFHVSTGGGSSLKFMQGEELPGITALTSC